MSLQAEDIGKSFWGNRVLYGTHLKTAPGVNLLIGANGSGKTTLINCISGLIRDYTGKVSFAGKDITRLALHEVFSHSVIRTFQTPRLFAKLSVLENLLLAEKSPGESFMMALRYHGWKGHESDSTAKALNVLDRLGIRHLADTLAYDCSGGQIKLVELGKTLMSDAGLIILDEPIAGINPTLAHEIFAHIVQISKETGATFLIIEHRLDIALQYADRVFVLGEGRIIAEDGPEHILSNKKVIESYLG